METTDVTAAASPHGRNPSRHDKSAGLAFDLGALLALTGLALGAGGLVNALRTDPLPWVYVDRAQKLDTAVAQVAEGPATPNPASDSADFPHEIRLDEFQEFVATRRGLVLDARPAVFYQEAHIPGALSLPREAFAEAYPRLRAKLEPFKDRPVAVYCSGADCTDSELLAEALTKLGYRRLLIYTSGWNEWSQTGLPQEGAHPSS